ncbi:efflux RND transporter periplasmic adaptor subunit [Lactobacillus iners]|uniref:efflux RND transporter periplasmic adaptor subunit n=1 Tax=Lactobacillus iners TaxID=147802 RepID=UPI001F09E303|nr:efflux RND transporter periplasmic adaptor subunit [Lactobacillus iners]MCT7785646.1 efflux RND transporter periplasmic adaptor subunit [Lactobacillus iners]MCT7800503.1 efflux RND transporter periplasmic adaptor subunit [Lactobacillus iners]
MSKKRILANTLTIVVIVGLILSITWHKSTENSRKSVNAEYYITKVAPTLTIPGTIVSSHIKQYNLTNSLTLKNKLFVKNNQIIFKGEPLYQITDISTIDNINDLKTELLDSYSQRKELSSKRESITNIDKNINKLELKINRLSNQAINIIYAPFDGTVSINENNDSDITMKLYSNSLEAKGYISQFDYFKVKPYQGTFVNSVIKNYKIKSKLSFLSKIADSQREGKYAFTIKIPSNSGFLNGQSVNISFVNDKLIAPRSYIKRYNNKYFVRLYKNKKKIYKKITGYYLGDYFYINSGINKGDKLIQND